MKKRILATAVAVMLLTGTPAQSEETRTVPVELETIFAPSGFDDNDNVEVVVYGYLLSSCYEAQPTTVTIDRDAKVISFKAEAILHVGQICTQALVPFSEVVKVGRLSEGDYRLISAAQPGEDFGWLHVDGASTESQDDYLYATARSVEVQSTPDGRQELKVSGDYPYMFIGCMILEEVRATVAGTNVLVVQPIAQLIDDDGVCGPQAENKEFEATVELTEPLPTDEPVLLHMRVINGESINRLVTIE